MPKIASVLRLVDKAVGGMSVLHSGFKNKKKKARSTLQTAVACCNLYSRSMIISAAHIFVFISLFQSYLTLTQQPPSDMLAVLVC